MTSSFRKVILPAVIAGLGLFSSGAAVSANIFFGEDGDTTFARVADFDVIAATITHINIFNGEDDIRVTGSFFSNTAAGLSGDSFAAMLEPGCVGDQCASDFIHVHWTSRAVSGSNFSVIDIIAEFGSDPESLGGFVCNGPAAGGNCIVEDGTVQDITGLLNLPANITMQAQSDVEASVPEPAPLALLGFGLAGIAALRRKHLV